MKELSNALLRNRTILTKFVDEPTLGIKEGEGKGGMFGKIAKST